MQDEVIDNCKNGQQCSCFRTAARLEVRSVLQRAVQRQEITLDDYVRRICGYRGEIPDEVRRAAQIEVGL